jgi:hypothetical protein
MKASRCSTLFKALSIELILQISTYEYNTYVRVVLEMKQ